MTLHGVILGTAAYMAPEQAKGRAVDKRADIWAFGCVLYEMLTGRKAFAGDDVSDTLASILKSDVDWTGVSPRATRLLKKCLEKDSRKRLHDVGDAWDLLDDHAVRVEPSRSSWLSWTMAAVFLRVNDRAGRDALHGAGRHAVDRAVPDRTPAGLHLRPPRRAVSRWQAPRVYRPPMPGERRRCGYATSNRCRPDNCQALENAALHSGRPTAGTLPSPLAEA